MRVCERIRDKDREKEKEKEKEMEGLSVDEMRLGW